MNHGRTILWFLILFLMILGISTSVTVNPTGWEDNFTDPTGISSMQNIDLTAGNVKIGKLTDMT